MIPPENQRFSDVFSGYQKGSVARNGLMKTNLVPNGLFFQHTSDTPTASPPIKQSPRIVAADTTHQPGPRTPPSSSTVSSSKTAEAAARTQKIKDTFKSKVWINIR